MADENNRIMRGSVDTVIISIDEDCAGHTCYLSIGDEKKCFITVTQSKIESTEEGSEVTFLLTQEDTLSLKAGDWSMQMRTVKDSVSAFVTEWVPISVGEAINKEMLEDVD